MPLYLSKVLRAKERALTPCSSAVFYLGLTFESLKELGACQALNFACSPLFTSQIDVKWLPTI